MKATLNTLHCISTLVLVLGAAPTVAIADVYEKPYVHEYVNGGYYSAAISFENMPSDPDVAAAPAADAILPAERPQEAPYDAMGYRNGGHFGPQNSDESLESAR